MSSEDIELIKAFSKKAKLTVSEWIRMRSTKARKPTQKKGEKNA